MGSWNPRARLGRPNVGDYRGFCASWVKPFPDGRIFTTPEDFALCMERWGCASISNVQSLRSGEIIKLQVNGGPAMKVFSRVAARASMDMTLLYYMGNTHWDQLGPDIYLRVGQIIIMVTAGYRMIGHESFGRDEDNYQKSDILEELDGCDRAFERVHFRQ